MTYKSFISSKKRGVLKFDDITTKMLYFNKSNRKKYIDPVDPFLPGDDKFTITWRSSIKFSTEAEPPLSMTMNGAPVRYIRNDRDKFALIFAGPDKDIDNKNFDLEQFKLNNRSSLRLTPVTAWLLPQFKTHNVLIYDPTNGLYSNGDIIWPMQIEWKIQYNTDKEKLVDIHNKIPKNNISNIGGRWHIIR